MGDLARFHELLRERLAHPDRVAEIDEELCRDYETDLAIMMTDSVGFSRGTRERGIAHILSLLLWHGDVLAPVIERHQGTLLKREADNLFAVFPTVALALAAGKAMHAELARLNGERPDELHVEICMGIGFGPVLRVEGDAFGDQVNKASKLGEDTAEAREILLTPEAYEALGDPSLKVTPFEVDAAKGLRLAYYRVDG